MLDDELKEHRDKIERFLVNDKGYSNKDIEKDSELTVSIDKFTGTVDIDFILKINDKRVILIKCTSGSLTTRERLALACARLFDNYQIPFTVLTSWWRTELLDTLTGKVIGEGFEAIPSKVKILEDLDKTTFIPFPEEKLEKEKRILLAFESIKCPTRK
ncbi:MAG: hypothetical protein AMJ45_00625 [Syntrophobacter sp. DG_60]|nr:MAG: hypothetical protein AMJ45_00625 [Syntrophobacter sp. DG_60]